MFDLTKESLVSNNGRHAHGGTIRVSARTFRELQLRASAFKDSPNDVIERLLGIEPHPAGDTIFDLTKTMLTSRGQASTQAKKEIKRRFVTFGWITSKAK